MATKPPILSFAPADCETLDEARCAARAVNAARLLFAREWPHAEKMDRLFYALEMSFWQRCDELAGAMLKKRKPPPKKPRRKGKR